MVFAPEQFEIVDARGYYRPKGSASLQEAVELVTAAITHAREQGVHDLLVNVLGLTGFGPPSLAERYRYAETWALASEGKVRLVVVVRRELIDPGKFGVTVAANRGMAGEVFETEVEAVAWLDSLK